jgi:hypothetical protein
MLHLAPRTDHSRVRMVHPKRTMHKNIVDVVIWPVSKYIVFILAVSFISHYLGLLLWTPTFIILRKQRLLKELLPAPLPIPCNQDTQLSRSVPITSQVVGDAFRSSVTVSDPHGRILFNFANQYCGAEIVPNFCSDGLPPTEEHSLNTPSFVLDNIAAADSCWQMDGASGQLGFALSDPVNITLFSVDYPDSNAMLAYSPRTLILWGLVDGNTFKQAYKDLVDLQAQLYSHLPPLVSPPAAEGNVLVPLAVAEYDPRVVVSNQVFSVFKEVRLLPFTFGIVIVQVLSNWGGNATRLCHVGVYGSVATTL